MPSIGMERCRIVESLDVPTVPTNANDIQRASQDFCVNLDDLTFHSGSSKGKQKKFLQKNFREGKHFVVQPFHPPTEKMNRGGHNRETIFLTEECADLMKSTYGLRNRYVTLLHTASGSLKQVKTLMTLENQTIGFIASCIDGAVDFKREMVIGAYRVDMCLPKHRLILECDEMGHANRDANAELARHLFLEGEGYELIRFNPNEPEFDISTILRQVVIRIVGHV
jgi:very-short-patch-repair endonuclease